MYRVVLLCTGGNVRRWEKKVDGGTCNKPWHIKWKFDGKVGAMAKRLTAALRGAGSKPHGISICLAYR